MAAVSSCGLYKEFEKPETAFADSLYRRLPTEADTTSIATLKWNDLFTDPILQNWIKVGIENINLAFVTVVNEFFALLCKKDISLCKRACG